MADPSPAVQAVILESRDAVAAKLWSAVTEGTDQVLRRMRDPKARLSDVATALRIVSEQHALLTGGVTERTESMSLSAALDLSEADSSALRDAINEELRLRREEAATGTVVQLADPLARLDKAAIADAIEAIEARLVRRTG